jgi:hypothetical protein
MLIFSLPSWAELTFYFESLAISMVIVQRADIEK